MNDEFINNGAADADANADAVWRRREIESPCVKVCVIHSEANICMGCFRTRHEIAGWSRLTGEERREIMATLPDREPLTRGRRRGGRAARSKA